jgi:undecaprenyl phosphate-alpha-L-ara4N flippase subunit ArnE
MSFNLYVTLLAGTIFGALGQIAFKYGATGREGLLGFLNISILLGLISYAFGTGLWIYALSRAPLSKVYPFTALTFIFVYLSGIFFFGETVTSQQLFGLFFVLFGLSLITLS